MPNISMKQLLEAGVHFGHQTRRWNPKMSRFIFTERNGIYIVDLQKTVKQLEKAYKFIKAVVKGHVDYETFEIKEEKVSNPRPILFVGTKKQAQDAVVEEATRCGQFYVAQRWLGGMLTNYQTIRTRVQRLKELEAMEESDLSSRLPKKEILKLNDEREKLDRFLGGIKNMNGMPGCVFVVDPKKEYIAVKEARKLGIPVVGIVDTNCDPDEIDVPIPGNDDAIRAVKLILGYMAEAIEEAQAEMEAEMPVIEEQEMATGEASGEEVAPTVETETVTYTTEDGKEEEVVLGVWRADN